MRHHRPRPGYGPRKATWRRTGDCLAVPTAKNPKTSRRSLVLGRRRIQRSGYQVSHTTWSTILGKVDLWTLTSLLGGVHVIIISRPARLARCNGTGVRLTG